MFEDKPSKRIPRTQILTLLVVIFFAFAFAYLEYNYILFDTIPFREAKPPAIANLYGYDLLVFIPALAVFSFSPFLHRALKRKHASLRRSFAFGLGSFLMSLIIKDASWYLFRTVAPIASDPLAYQWIRPLDYSATVLGYADILGARIPLWYIALLPLIVAIFVSLRISHPAPRKEDVEVTEAYADESLR